MGDYTKLSESQVQQIFSLYKDEMVQSFSALSLGISNSNYAITTSNNKYLLKISNDKNTEELLEEMEILTYLNKKGYQYSLLPFKTKENEFVYKSDDLYGVLFPFVDGIPPGPSDSTCFEIGTTLANLHNINVDDACLRHCEKLSYPANIIKTYTQNANCPTDFKEAYDQLLGERADQYLKEDFQKGIIHGDLYYDNTLFDNNHIKVVLDFEQSGLGNVVLDLGISISGCCLEKGRICPNLIKSYLKGYESIRILKENEKDFLNEAIIFGLLSIALWRIKRFKDGDLNPLMADSYKELINRAIIFKKTVNL